MAVSLLRRLAGDAPVPVFPILGAGSRWPVARLRADERVELVASPRHATVLLVAGALPPDLLGPALHVHDQLPSPRAVVRWGDDASWPGPSTSVPGSGDVVTTLTDVHRGLVTGALDSAPPLLPSEHPVPWQGVGPYGHGGEGMMGGKPYGRMMPMPPQEGRDGLALDRLELTLGPHLAGFPPGLRLDVGLQGDVLETVALGDNPFVTPRAAWDGEPLPDARPRDRHETALLRLADLLALAGTTALATRAANLAVAGATAPDLASLGRSLRRATTLRWMTDGVGRVDAEGRTTDARDRWTAWLDPDAEPVPTTRIEHLPDLLTGLEVGEAMTTIATLGIDLEAAAETSAGEDAA